MQKNIRVSGAALIIGFINSLESSKGIKKIMDKNGNLIIPANRFGEFCHDIGLMLARVISTIAEEDSGETKYTIADSLNDFSSGLENLDELFGEEDDDEVDTDEGKF